MSISIFSIAALPQAVLAVHPAPRLHRAHRAASGQWVMERTADRQIISNHRTSRAARLAARRRDLWHAIMVAAYPRSYLHDGREA